MRFFEAILSGAAIIAAALALEINDYPSSGVVAGQTYTVTYSPKDNTPTTFILRQGPSGNLNTVQTLTTTATGGSFTWTVPKDLADQSNYALQIQQGDVINYSGQFPLTGGSGSVSSAVASAVSSAKASASSAAASAASSAKAALSSAVASAVSSAKASASIVPSSGANSTIASATLSHSATATSKPTGTSSAKVPESTGAASSLATSPFAAIVGAIAAFAYLA